MCSMMGKVEQRTLDVRERANSEPDSASEIFQELLLGARHLH